MNFKEFALDERLIEAIDSIGYQVATPVQQQAIPAVLNGKDIIVSAQTGTGKTAAFLLPVIHNIITSKQHDNIKALILVPTRELVIQIDQLMQGLSYFTNVSSVAVYGGSDGASFSREKQALQEGVDMVISTPGRLIAHLNMKYVSFEHIQYLILDEADRMLDIGFYHDIMKIISYMPEKRQNLLFSATMPKKIMELSKVILKNPLEISLAISKPAEKIVQEAFVVYENQKIPLVKHILAEKSLQKVIVFCSTKVNVKLLTQELKKSKFLAQDIQSDLDQKTREEILLNFRNNKLNILVATDILSRGIDIEDIDLVINFDVPHDGEDYIHRIGRTARAESNGIAYTLISEKEQGKFLIIEELIGKEIFKATVPEHFGLCPSYEPQKKKFFKQKKKSKNFKRKPSNG